LLVEAADAEANSDASTGREAILLESEFGDGDVGRREGRKGGAEKREEGRSSWRKKGGSVSFEQ